MASVQSGAAPLRYSGIIAGAGLTAATAQYKFVKFSADNTVVLCAATTDIPCGILQEPAVATGEPVDVVYGGSSLLQASASMTAGVPISTNASGQGQTAVATQYPVGIPTNVGGATTAGTLVTVVVNCANPIVKA